MRSMRVLFAMVGLALVATVYLLLVPWPWPDRVWLPFAVTCLVLIVNAVSVATLLGPPRRFGRRIASLGVLWLADGVYSVLALSGAYGALWFIWPVRFQVAYQLILLAGLGLAYLLARSADDHVETVHRRELEITGRLDALRSLSPEQRSALQRLRASEPARAARFDRWLENVRYLSPISTQEASDMDRSMLSLSARFLASPSDDLLDTMETLLVSRKSLMEHDDLRSHY